MMNPSIKIMVADDHQVLRHALCHMLDVTDDFKITGEAGDGAEMLELVRRNPPDIVITDLEMPKMNGAELARELGRLYPGVKVMLLSMYYSPYHAMNAFENSLHACLPKECSFDTLVEAIRAVYHDSYYFKPDLNHLRSNAEQLEQKFSRISSQLSLSHREVEILRLICEGLTHKEIAERLGVTASTIDFHKQNIYKKAGVNTAVMLIRYAIRNGLITI